MGKFNLFGLAVFAFALAACGGGGGGGGGTPGLPGGPAVITMAATAGDASISFTFNSISGATGYTIYYRTTPGVTTSNGTSLAAVTSPTNLPGLANGTTYYAIATYTDASGESAPSAQVSATPQTPASSPYDPTWANVAASTTIAHTYNSGQTQLQNGTALRNAILALTAGQKLEIGTGTYELSSNFTVNLQGTAGAPIWVVAAAGASPVIYMNTTGQNIMNVGQGSQSRYLCFRGIEFTGGSHGLRFYDCTQVWLDECEIHNTGDAGISTNTANTSFIYITRNEIHDTDGTGEGMYLGANNGAVIMSQSVIALNHVYNTNAGTVAQGDGIELKQGSWGNLIAENHCHDNNYPCILVYGTAGQPQNIVERNLCYRSNDNAMQIQGECIVRNNLVISATGSAFASQPHQGNPTNLQVLHNTFINGARAARLNTWSGAANMLFANNACYSTGNMALDVVGGLTGIGFAGNVLFGTVTAGVPGGSYTVGAGLSDFVNVSVDGNNRNAHLSAASACKGAASTANATASDMEGTTRVAPHDAGCYED